jgi:hypothetical protein
MKNSTKDKIMDIIVDTIVIGALAAFLLSLAYVFYTLYKGVV